MRASYGALLAWQLLLFRSGVLHGGLHEAACPQASQPTAEGNAACRNSVFYEFYRVNIEA